MHLLSGEYAFIEKHNKKSKVEPQKKKAGDLMFKQRRQDRRVKRSLKTRTHKKKISQIKTNNKEKQKKKKVSLEIAFEDMSILARCNTNKDIVYCCDCLRKLPSKTETTLQFHAQALKVQIK
ncbi:hypothetical protein RFI_12269 [Reticulomyxa filosa]|uniref:Uncharacterized protein n=1 Tax=Reticulomyxa filosa TaxID=46433 RepID=X6NHT4_RETFI|nr:hypothetical protein RFI_12269 [Reticulomyxa filosa]|eukprot:ETO24887.1 hypothetical protein RFI_12269 [Reticulomyxa filosa]